MTVVLVLLAGLFLAALLHGISTFYKTRKEIKNRQKDPAYRIAIL